VHYNVVHVHEPTRAGGFLESQRARVRWFLSTNKDDLPWLPADDKPTTYRSMTIDGEEVEFTHGFGDLHTRSYEEILAGRGFTLEDAKPAVDIVSSVRRSKPDGLRGDYHPFLKRVRHLLMSC
jgi:UDP-N-acetyl-2-amino-2-deoxyglucuronate dehydrogenase